MVPYRDEKMQLAALNVMLEKEKLKQMDLIEKQQGQVSAIRLMGEA